MASRLVEVPKAYEVRDHRMLVGGGWSEARPGKALESVDPYAGRVRATVPGAFDEGPRGTVWVDSCRTHAFDTSFGGLIGA